MEIASRRREQEVWQACDDLWAMHGEVKSLTGDAIRAHLLHLGKSKGSPNEIYRYRKTWSESRKISEHSRSSFINEDNDPISRAVRLVHEKIQNEADNEIKALTDSFSLKEQALGIELTQMKEQISSILQEFSLLQESYSSLQAENTITKNQLTAETELRMLMERELRESKNAFEVAKISHKSLIEDLTKNNQAELLRLKDIYEANELKIEKRTEEILVDRKKLGQEYSEALNELKTEKYNLQIKAERGEEKLLELSALLVDQKKMIAQLEKNAEQNLFCMNELKLKNEQANRDLFHLAKQLDDGKIAKKTLQQDLRKLRMELKQSSARLTRLRTMVTSK